jgi:gamma-glutamyltranspeptidase/glutathione hydrolase
MKRNPRIRTNTHKFLRFVTIRVYSWMLLALLAVPLAVPAASRAPERGRSGMVASTNEIASAIGVDVLKRGGNAVDAAVAVALALAVVHPAAGNLGGGGFMLIRLQDGRTTAIDYRETAPAAASRGMYLDAKGNMIPDSSTVGYLAAGVPGTPAGLDRALRTYGTMKWADLVEPARKLAAEGFPVDYRTAVSLRENAEDLSKFPDSKRIFLRDGRFLDDGELLRQPELAATLARMQRLGASEFYEGETARMIAADMKANGGIITLDDLRGYKPKERVPLRGSYRGYEIVTMPPPSSGGAVLLEMLNILERYDLGALGYGSSQALHLEVEAMRRAYADRAEYMGDADFVKVPIEGIISKKYAAERAATIDPVRASTSTQILAGKPQAHESAETTHFTIVDAAGSVVSNTYTLNGSYGSAVTAKGTGVLLNNEMDDFAAKPGTPNLYGLVQKEGNAVEPGKRPLSSMTPTIVLKDGKVWFAVGSPGGGTIINTVLQVILNVIDFKMDIQEAVDAPKIHHQWLPDLVLFERNGMTRDVQEALKARGYTVSDNLKPVGYSEKSRSFGDAHAILIEDGTGVRLGASDARNPGKAIGY